MAKKARTVNKSQEVRDHITAKPEDGPSAISAALKKRGIVVSPNFVSNIKLKMKKSNGAAPKKRGRKPKAITNGAGYDHVYAAANFIRTCGGVQQAREALAVAAKVIDAGV